MSSLKDVLKVINKLVHYFYYDIKYATSGNDMRTRETFTEPDAEEFEPHWVALGELEHSLQARLHHCTLVSDLTDAVVSECEQIPAAMLQHLLESLAEEWKLL